MLDFFAMSVREVIEVFSAVGFNFCVMYRREVDYDLKTLAREECGEYAKHNGCGNCPYSVYITVAIMETNKYVEVKVHGVKKTRF